MKRQVYKSIILLSALFLLLSSSVYAQNLTDDSNDSTSIPNSADKSNHDDTSSTKTNTLKKPAMDIEQLQEAMRILEEKINKMNEENDIRHRLEATAEEKSSDVDSVLSAAGRDYTLMKPGYMGVEFYFSYTGDAYDSVYSNLEAVNHNAYHTLTTGFNLEYPILDNLTTTCNVPFVYKYSSESNTSTVKDISDVGDVSFGCQFQPIKSGGDRPAVILSAGLSCPTGRSPYKIDSTREMSTGNGGYSINMGCNMSKSVDPVVVFGGLQGAYHFSVNNLHYQSGHQGENGIYLQSVDPGDMFSWSMGIAYSLSYNVNLSMAYQYSYQSKNHYDWVGQKDVDTTGTISSQLSIGTGWNISPKKSINVKVGIGLTSNDPAFTVSFRVPFTYVL